MTPATRIAKALSDKLDRGMRAAMPTTCQVEPAKTAASSDEIIQTIEKLMEGLPPRELYCVPPSFMDAMQINVERRPLLAGTRFRVLSGLPVKAAYRVRGNFSVSVVEMLADDELVEVLTAEHATAGDAVIHAIELIGKRPRPDSANFDPEKPDNA